MDSVALTILALITVGSVMTLLLSRFFGKKWLWFLPIVMGVLVTTPHSLLALIAAGSAMSLLISRFFRKKWLWYVPSVIGLLVITYYSLKIQFENLEGFEALGYMIINTMVASFMTGNLLTNVLILRRRKMTKTE